MALPNRDDIERERQQRQPQTSTQETNAEHAREIITSAVLDAVKLYHDIVKDANASEPSRISAAKAIMDLGYNPKKPSLNVNQDDTDIAQFIADAILQARLPEGDPATTNERNTDDASDTDAAP